MAEDGIEDTTGSAEMAGAEWLPMAEAATRVGRSVRTLRRLAADGKIVTRDKRRPEDPTWVRWDTVAALYPPTERMAGPTVPPVDPARALVPFDAYREVAGKLAEVTGRAEKAEAVEAHLRERLAELRAELERLRSRRWWRRPPTSPR